MQLAVLQDDLEHTREQLQSQVPLVSFATLAARRAFRTILQKGEASLSTRLALCCC